MGAHSFDRLAGSSAGIPCNHTPEEPQGLPKLGSRHGDDGTPNLKLWASEGVAPRHHVLDEGHTAPCIGQRSLIPKR